MRVLCPSWKGGGKSLVVSVNNYLKENHFKGLLFCKEKLISFYKKYDWELIPQERVSLPTEDVGVYTMVFNSSSFDHLDYSDRMF